MINDFLESVSRAQNIRTDEVQDTSRYPINKL